MSRKKSNFKKWSLVGLSTLFVVSSAMGVSFSLLDASNDADASQNAILAPRYVYDTSITEGVFGVGSTIALPKATIQDTINGGEDAETTVTVLYNGTVVQGYDGVVSYADNFTFKNAGTYEIIYAHANSQKTRQDGYSVQVTETAPVVTMTERTPYIVQIGENLQTPNVQMSLNGKSLDYDVNLYYPDKSAYRFEPIALTEDGLYQVEIKTVVNETVYSYVKSIYAYGINVDFSGAATPYYGAPSFENKLQEMKSYTEKSGADKLSWTNGLNVSFSKGDVFKYEKPIKLSELGVTDKFIKFYVNPTEAQTVYFYVDLVDANDENNVVTVRFCSVPMTAGSKSYRTYVSTAATGIGQVFAGRNNDVLYIDRLSGGAYTSTDVSGIVDTNLYYPLSFAFDEETKQICTNLLDRESNLIVADLDDTQTYFETVWSETQQILGGQKGYYSQAWEGFSSDEVYLRMHVEGDYAGDIGVTITKIGNHDLTPKFASLLPSPTVVHKAQWSTALTDGADYTASYGAPSFETTLKATDSYAKTNSDKLTWTNGINLSLGVGDSFNYPELIDLSKLSSTDKLFKILINPTGAATVSAYAELIDENDPENILSVRFVSCDTSGGKGEQYRVYVSTAALKIGQPYTGVQSGTTLFYNRPTGGFYTSTDITGLNTSLYYPLSFAYDETTKQVFTSLFDRDANGLVADMDDTTTVFQTVWNGSTNVEGGQKGYFTKAWGGFSTNKVYLRVRLEGVSSSVSATLLKAGNNDLSKFVAKKPSADEAKGYYTFDGNSVPYYGEPSFKSTMLATESYAKTTSDKLVVSNGINVTFNKSDEFYYGTPIDLSKLGATDKIFKIYIAPTGLATTSVYVDLIDENDPENILSVRFVSCDTSGGKGEQYRVYVSTAALKIGQPYTGVQSGTTLFYNRPTGGFYTSTDITGLNTSLYYPLSFAYDETTKQVFTSLFDRDANGLVADMDDTTTVFQTVWNGSTNVEGGQKGYFTKAWSGFSTNKVYLRVRFDGGFENPLETCITRIGTENLEKTGVCESTFADDTFRIDTQGYSLDNLPNAIVGKAYPLFQSEAYDATGRKLNVTTKIYYENTNVQIANDGVSFVAPKEGKYVVVYTAKDRLGYVSTKKFEIVAVKSEDAKAPVIEVEQTAMTVTTGLAVELPEYSVSCENGYATTTVELFYQGELIKTYKQGDALVYTPTSNGVYTVKYVATNYVGSYAEATVTITSQPQNNPIFQGDVVLPEILINGWGYDLPKLVAVDYTGEQPKEIVATIKAYDSRNGYKVEDGKYTPTVEQSQIITLIYSVTTENGYAEKEYTVRVQKTDTANGLNVAEYFVGENVSVTATANAVSVTASKSGAVVKFVNPLIIGKNGLTFMFTVPKEYNNVDKINVYLTDSQNAENKIKITLFKGSAQNENDKSFTTMQVNDDVKEYRVPGSFVSGVGYEITYDNITRCVTALNGVKATVEKTVTGEEFKGFEGQFVYLSFEFGNRTGSVRLDITKLNNQSLNSKVVSDNMAPQIAIRGQYGGMAMRGKETKIMSAIAGDVLAEKVTVTMTVETPSGSGKAVSVDGITLENVDGSREYTFIPTAYGTYRIVFKATDSNGWTSTTSYNIVVADNDGPEITVKGKVPTELTLKNGKAVLTLPEVTATDDSGKECRIVFNLKRPDGTMVRLEEDKVTISAVGRYVLYVSAYDASGNQTLESFEIFVK